MLENRDLEVRALGAELENGRARYTVRLRILPRRNVRNALQESTALPNVQRVGVSGLHEVE